ncbi:MAG TPA: FAD-dependent oxidoreductase, partial [Runella sp.]|nr:FAD-dependent oxidoreductase [Runella sp.]
MFNLNRRKFLRSAIVSTSAATLLSQETEAASPEADTFKEPAQNLPIKDEVDVLVCGAGPAGVSAAITAARAGAKTQLIEIHGCLGGVWTAGLLTYIFDFNKPGL